MVTLDKIEKALSDDSAEGKLQVSTFREILSILLFDERILGQLDLLLQSLETLLPIAASLDKKYSEVWPRWLTTTSNVRKILKRENSNNSAQSEKNHNNKKASNPWHGNIGNFPLITCLAIPIQAEKASGLLPAKAILLIRFYGRAQNDGTFSSKYPNFDNFLADSIRKSCTSSPSHYYSDFIPSWPSSSAEAWKASFNIKTRHFKSHNFQFKHANWGDYDVVLSLRITLELVSNDKHSVKSNKQDSSALHPNFPSAYSRKQMPPLVLQTTIDNEFQPKRKRPCQLFTYFQERPPSVDVDTDGLAPAVVMVASQAETPSEQPVQLQSVQSLDVRYSNYRTAMDNQHLPWQWDCLNDIEISTLQYALLSSYENKNASTSEKHGALIVWLLLVTGQNIDAILSLDLGYTQDSRSALLPGPLYRRSIIPPRNSYQPTIKEQKHLSNHSAFVELRLPSPFPHLINELGLFDSNISRIKEQVSLGDFLQLDKDSAEHTVRQFLEIHRTRNFRLLPGRIRNVLSREIMRVTNDPVVTHLLTSLRTDMPPTGVYYTSYSVERLERIYAEATARIFGA